MDDYCDGCADKDNEILSLERQTRDLLKDIEDLKSILHDIENAASDIVSTARNGARY